MSTKRQDILTKIKEDIENIVDNENKAIFAKVTTDTKTQITDLDKIPLPAVFIYSDTEIRLEDDRSVIGKETWEWYVILEVWCRNQEPEELLGEIHTAMYDDYKFNNLAEYSDRMGVNFFVVDPTRQLECMVITYRILYRHENGIM